MKVLAMYLPQFHRTKENDEWWGEGFTEWTAAKAAVPLFSGHKQPHVPYKCNYYNLLHRDTMEWQADLLKKYGIDGLVFYHYYFKDGRMMLEKPAENLLEWKGIDMPFCFSWANESWVRSWSNIPDGNPWSQVFDKKIAKSNGNDVLLEQAYGKEKQWEEHFNYLLPFFKDDRYIYEDGKPVFIFHRPDSIPCLKEMIQYWNRLAEKNGLLGIYVIGTNAEDVGVMNEVVQLEPQYTMESYLQTSFKEQHVRAILDYDEIWESIIRGTGKHTDCLSGFVGYDDTPRRGENGIVITGASVKKFERYMQLLFCKADKEKSKFIFLNAWNEWGEGMYLEPDEESKYGYLEAFSHARSYYEEMQNEFNKNYLKNENIESLLKENKNLKRQVERYRALLRITDYWMTAREKSSLIVKRLYDINIRCIAIYGMGSLGRHLVWEIGKYNKEYPDQMITIDYGIDQSGKSGDYPFQIYRLSDGLPTTDAVVVTVTYEFEQISEQLKKVLDCKILSLERLLIE